MASAVIHLCVAKEVNKYLDINECEGYIINCYDIFDIKEEVNNIIRTHDFYINTTYYFEMLV